MGLFNIFRGRASLQPIQLRGHIADTPRIVVENGQRYMVFYLSETDETEFRLRMLPDTSMRRKGERVMVTFTADDDGVVEVEALCAAPDGAAFNATNGQEHTWPRR